MHFSLLSIQWAESLNLLNYYGKTPLWPVKITVLWEYPLRRHGLLHNDLVMCNAALA